MATSKSTLEDLYSRLSLEEEDEGGLVVAAGEIKARTTCMSWWVSFLRRKTLILMR